MQAIILAGGYGTRLYPLTINAPKPMIQVGGKPMIEYLIKKLENLGNISEIFIITNAKFSHVFEEWLKNKTKKIHMTIINDGTTSNEDRLGALGDIQYVLDTHKITEDVIILAGDNFFEDDLIDMVENFKAKGDTVGLVDVGDTELVKQYGNVGVDEDGKITSFIEKPVHPIGTLCSTAIYLYNNATLSHIKELLKSGKSDRTGDLVAHLAEKEDIYGVVLRGKWFDIGTLEQLKKAEEWIELKNG